MKSEIERRRVTVQPETPVKLESRADAAADELPNIVGYTAVFGVDTEIQTYFGSFRERIQKGAFQRAIRERQNARALRNHDPDNLLGSVEGKTLELKEDATGLFVEIKTPNTTLGRDTVELIKRGDLSGMSFAFIVRKEKWVNGEDGSPDLRVIQDVDLFDVGPVTYPAYAQTTADTRSSSKAYQAGLAELGKPIPRLPEEDRAAAPEPQIAAEEAEEVRSEEAAKETVEAPIVDLSEAKKRRNRAAAEAQKNQFEMERLKTV